MPVALLALASVASVTTALAQPAPARDYSGEAFVIERSQTTYRFENDGTGRHEVTARIRVQSDAGVQQWGQLIFGYNAATERLDIDFVRVLKPGGVVITAPPEAVQDLSAPVARDAPIYTDFRQKHVTVPSLRPGETLEFAVVTTVHTPLAAGQFWVEHDFRSSSVTLDDRLEVDVPAGRTITLKTAADQAPEISESRTRRVYRWRSSQLKPSSDQIAAMRDLLTNSDGEPQRPQIRLTTFQSWDDVGRWYAALERPSRAVTAELSAKARELTAGKASSLERVEALYNYVALNFRYVSISLGAGRYQPRPAADVLRDQYGDCKDKHTLLAALLESIGLPVATVLIHSNAPLDPDFPSPSQFDHAITRVTVDGEAIWLDVTTEVAPFRLLAPALRDKQALLVDGGAGHLERTPQDAPIGNRQDSTITGELGDFGALTAHVSYAVRGDLEIPLRAAFRNTPSTQWKEVIETIDAVSGLDGTVSEWTVSDPAITDQPFTIAYDVTKEAFVDGTKKSAAVSLPMAEFGLPELDDKRQKKVVLGSPQQVHYSFRLTLAPGFVPHAPQPVTLSRDYATYQASYAVTGQTMTAERTLFTHGREIATERLGDYAAFRRVVTADTAQRLTIDIPATAASGRAAPVVTDADLMRRVADAARSQDFELVISLLKEVVTKEPRHPQAWLILGTAYATVQDYDNAITAFQKHLEVDAFDDKVYLAMGMVYRAQGRRDEAEASYKKQLELNPLDGATREQLAQFYLENRRYADAIPLLDQMSAAAADNADLHASRGYAYLNAGREDDALAAFDKAIELQPTGTIRNNVAYYLAQKGVHLDRAEQYADAAVTGMTAESRSLTLAHVTDREIGVVRSLANFWDTLGWVRAAKGDLASAETLLLASWRLGESAVAGDHLGQVFEKQGRSVEAISAYAAALAAPRADEEIRERLRRVAGEKSTAALEEAHKNDGLNLRTLPVGWSGVSGTAEFFVLIGEKGVEDVAFIAGDAALNTAAVAASVRAADYRSLRPPGSALSAKLIRRGALTCATTSGKGVCSFILYPAPDVKPAIQ